VTIIPDTERIVLPLFILNYLDVEFTTCHCLIDKQYIYLDSGANFQVLTMVLTDVREQGCAYAYFSCNIFWFGEFVLCSVNDNIIVDCFMNIL